MRGHFTRIVFLFGFYLSMNQSFCQVIKSFEIEIMDDSSILHAFNILDSTESCAYINFSALRTINGNIVNSEELSSDEAIAIIADLLKLKGDKRICCSLPYDKSELPISSPSTKHYTIEIEALLMINQIYFKEPFKYSPLPELFNRNDSLINSDETIELTYQQYKAWFKKLEQLGIDIARSKELLPLNGREIYWRSF